MPILKTFNSRTRFNAPPLIDFQMARVNDNCLELICFFHDAYTDYGRAGMLVFLFFAMPFNIMVWDDFNIYKTTFEEVLWLIMFSTPLTLMGLGYSIYNLISARRYSLIRFNRHTQKVYATVYKRPCEADWNDATVEQFTGHEFSGASISRRDLLRFHVFEPGKDKKYLAVIEANENHPEYGDRFESTWEYLCHFMQSGSNDLPMVSHSHARKLSRDMDIAHPPKAVIKRHWFFPVYYGHDSKSIRSIRILTWPIRVVMYVPLVLTDICWYYLVKLFGGGIATHPEQANEGCDSSWLTFHDYADAIRDDEYSITYQEVKKRLGK